MQSDLHAGATPVLDGVVKLHWGIQRGLDIFQPVIPLKHPDHEVRCLGARKLFCITR